MDYLDFDLEIAPGTGRDYPVSVRSPAGQAYRTLAIRWCAWAGWMPSSRWR
jgi:hypothetical protein